MRLRVLLAASLGLAVPAVGHAVSEPSWRALHRPLHIPRIAPGSRCPVSGLRNVQLEPGEVRPLRGAGPAYPILDDGGVLRFYWPPLASQPDFYGTGWSGNKVMWVVRPSYTGRVLVRGRQLDGPRVLRFDAPMTSERRLWGSTGSDPVRRYPGYTRVAAPGCYAYQIDGTSFSRVIVFEARVVPPPQP